MSSAKKTLLALVLPLATTACSNGRASVSNTANAANGDFICKESISIEEGAKASYDQYCKLNTGGKFTIEPKTIDTSTVGTTEQGLTLTDSAGNISYVIIPVTVKAKPTPSPTAASTPEATQDSQTESKAAAGSQPSQQASAQQSAEQQNSSRQQSGQQAAAQQSTTRQQTQPSQQQATQNYDVEDNSSLSGPSAPSGSTYDTLQACQANMGNGGGASTVGCVWNDELRKYVLTY